jgi:REP element-mobilizing transposase RayT
MMPRYARKKSDIGIFHIMLRGINKQTIFEDDEDRRRFMETIERFKAVSKYEIYGYCLMSNHVHLLLKETEEAISTAIKRICSSYVYWYNWKYERCGHLFQERYKSEIVENDAYLLTVLRYIHQNPVKAGISKSTQDYKWSSYNEYIKEPTITDIEFILEILSANREKALVLFIEHTIEQNDDKCLDYEEKVRLSDHEVRGYFTKSVIDRV